MFTLFLLVALQPDPRYLITEMLLFQKNEFVRSVRSIEIPRARAPYNGSLIQTDETYQLFFRYDNVRTGDRSIPYFSYVGCVELDNQFHLLSTSSQRIDTHSRFSEDPRVFQVDSNYFLLFNDRNDDGSRSMRIAELDIKEKTLHQIKPLELDTKLTEKNWAPFVYEGKPYLIYSISPHRVLEYDSLLPVNAGEESVLSELDWPTALWGQLRGGTPAQLVDGEYLAFFHSSFGDWKRAIYYVMGAYTFEAAPPFRITRISPHPIVFQGMYDSILINPIAKPRLHCIYPAGFVCDGETIYLSCGENDSAIKILTLDKRALLNSLKAVNLLSYSQ